MRDMRSVGALENAARTSSQVTDAEQKWNECYSSANGTLGTLAGGVPQVRSTKGSVLPPRGREPLELLWR